MSLGKIASGVATGGVFGGMLGYLPDMMANKADEFKDTKKKTNNTPDEISGATATMFVIFIILVVILTILFLIAIYKMMPSYKALHLVMTLLLGCLWYMPALFYYCVMNDYTLVNRQPTVTVNNRFRNSRYL